MNFFRNVTIRFRLLALTALLCLFTAAASWVGYFNLDRAGDGIEGMYHRGLQPVEWVNDARAHLQAIKADLFDMMLTTDVNEKNRFLKDIQARREINNENFKNLKAADLAENEKKLLAEAEKHLADFRSGTDEVFALALKNENAEAYQVFLKKASPPLEKENDALVKLARMAVDMAEKIDDDNDALIDSAHKTLMVIAVVSVLLGAAFGVLISFSVARSLAGLRGQVELFAGGDLGVKFDESGRDEVSAVARSLAAMGVKLSDAVSSIRDASQRLGSSAEEFSALAEETNASVEESRAGVDDVSSQMDSLAAASQEVNASVEEVAGGAQSSAHRSTEMAGEVERARASGEEGVEAVDKVASSIAKVASDAERSAGEVRNLGDRAREIQGFVTQIGGIADQTNLLALNAAIEAARAGEAGRGFAVVAEEVRKLAEESNEAAKKIADLAGIITRDLDAVVTSSEENARESAESSELATETRATIDKMMDGLSAIASAIQDMAAVSEEQAASSQEISAAMQNITSRAGDAASASDTVRAQMTEVASAAEQVAQGSEQLTGLSVELLELVGFFRLAGDGAKGLVPAGRGR
ncbi:MAG: methyl-accepting chemotaxis protein [Aminivibrio sp.]|jgi:methyl-accepting chemotaxis protein|nr:methyl-accepting chemotaxis protein [Synergistaceae bacterium]